MTSAVRSFGLSLPDYPWEAMAPYLAKAAEHPGGSGQPLHRHSGGPHAPMVQEALQRAADAPGYPTVHGTPALRAAIADWFGRRRGVPGLDPQHVMPTVGSKELVAWLPFLLGSSRATSSSVLQSPTPPTTSGRLSPEPNRSPLTTSTNWTTKRGSVSGWSG